MVNVDENLTCSFIGCNNKIVYKNVLKNQLTKVVRELIAKGIKQFLFGSRNQFTDICYEVVTQFKQDYPFLVRVACPCNSEIFYLESERAEAERFLHLSFNNSITLQGYDARLNKKTEDYTFFKRNEEMINLSDVCVFYLREKVASKIEYRRASAFSFATKSGSQIAYEYAKSNGKITILV